MAVMGRPKVEYSRGNGGKSFSFYMDPMLFDAIRSYATKSGMRVPFFAAQALRNEIARCCGCDPEHILDRDEDGNFVNIR